MISSYIKTASRNLLRNIGYSILNISGLTISIAACLLIFLIVKNELNYDSWHKKADRIYRVTMNGLDFNPSVSMAVTEALKNDFPELESVSQYWYQTNGLITIGDTRYNEAGYAYADEYFPRIFDHRWLAGDPRTALSEPDEVVLTESIARKYFGSKDPLGEMINLNNQLNLKVTGVVADPPQNSSQPFIFLVSFATVKKDILAHVQFFSINGGHTYIVLPEHYNPARLAARLPDFISRNWGADVAKETKLLLQPLKEIHFDQRYLGNPVHTTTSRETYWGLSAIALLIIITASINFINMATAQAIRRAKEVGVRKVLGAYKGQLIGQFLIETTVLVVIAVMLGTLLAATTLPLINTWMGMKISAAQFWQPAIMGLLGGITVVVILLAGLYPAFVQAAFQPAISLKANTGIKIKGLGIRKILVSSQFGISQVLIACTLIVGYQMDFLQNKDLGFDKNAVLSFNIPNDNKRELLREQLSLLPGVRQVSIANGAPVGPSGFAAFNCPEAGLVKNDVTEIKAVDEHYMDMFSLRLLAGEPIRKRGANDTLRRVVVNEIMLHKLGIRDPDQAPGKRFYINNAPVTIMGVVKDYQSESRHKKRRPCVLEYDPNHFGMAAVRLAATDMPNTIARIDKLWSGMFPDYRFEYEFLDDRIAGMYKQEQKVYTAFKLFSSLAILIGCLGLYGLVAFAAAQRTREVGIRKILGAGLPQIVSLFAREFILLIFIAFCIAGPLAWYTMHRWLGHFAYQTSIGGGTFLIAIGISLLIAGITISYQAVKAGLADPVRSLRN
jgi:hypothetical protein